MNVAENLTAKLDPLNLQAAYDLDLVQRASTDRIARDVNPREPA